MAIYMIGKVIKWTVLIAAVSTVWIWLPLLLLTSPIWTVSIGFVYTFIRVFGLGDFLQRLLSWVMYFVFLRFSWMRRLTWKTFYNLVATHVPSDQVKVMNCGYKALRSEEDIDIPDECQGEKFSYQLYHYVSTGLGSKKSLEGLHVLDVGSGRGGGLQYVAKYLKPTSAVGLDLSKGQVLFSKKHCVNTNLMFAQGNAERMPVKDSCVDVVICIESSHCFSDFNSFMAEVSRVLVKGGHLFFADMRYKDELAALDGMFRASQMTLVRKHDITDHVVGALEDDAERRQMLIKKLCPIWLRPMMKHFAAAPNSTVFDSLKTRERKYLAYDLVKPK